MTTYDDYGIPVGAYSEPESLTHQAWRVARAFYLYRMRPFASRGYNGLRRGDWSFRRLFTLVNALVLLWWVVLYWGERGIFNAAINSCSWDRWEDWVRYDFGKPAWQRLVPNTSIGSWRESPQAHLRRRPATHRPAHVSWPPVASQPARVQVHRSLLAPHILSLTDFALPRYHILPGGSVRRRSRMGYPHNRLAGEAVSQIWRWLLDE
jgi:hypothetical protein